MSQITIIIAQRSYQVACDDGQEAQLTRLSRYLDQRASQLEAAVGGAVPETLLLVMVGLLVADELAEAHAECDSLRDSAHPVDTPDTTTDHTLAEDAIAARIEDLTQRLEMLADRME